MCIESCESDSDSWHDSNEGQRCFRVEHLDFKIKVTMLDSVASQSTFVSFVTSELDLLPLLRLSVDFEILADVLSGEADRGRGKSIV